MGIIVVLAAGNLYVTNVTGSKNALRTTLRNGLPAAFIGARPNNCNCYLVGTANTSVTCLLIAGKNFSFVDSINLCR